MIVAVTQEACRRQAFANPPNRAVVPSLIRSLLNWAQQGPFLLHQLSQAGGHKLSRSESAIAELFGRE